MMTEAQYRKYPAINFTSLTWLDIHPKVYYNNKYHAIAEEDKSYFAVGGGLDVLLTGGIKEFKEQYYILKEERPSGMMGILAEKYLFYINSGIPDGIAFDQAFVDSGYKPGKNNVSKNKIREKLDKEKYIVEKLKYMNKYRTLTHDEGKLVLNMAETVEKYDRINKWFRGGEGVEVLKQFPIIFNLIGKECKGLLDILYIDHKNKKICPIDLKTTGTSVKEFRNKFKTFRYYLQASFYTEAVEQWKVAQTLAGIRDFSEYTVDQFRFLVIEKELNSVPMCYQCTEDDIKCGRYGGMIGKEYHRGYLELINNLSWHESTGKWNAEKDVYEANFEVKLGIFNNGESRTSTTEAESTQDFPF